MIELILYSVLIVSSVIMAILATVTLWGIHKTEKYYKEYRRRYKNMHRKNREESSND
jgi:lipopolysaccharide export LptBFGC system permease protein LptF